MKAFQINETDVYSGSTLDDAISAAMKDRNETRAEVVGDFQPYEVEPAATVGDPDTPDMPLVTIGDMLKGVTDARYLCGYDA